MAKQSKSKGAKSQRKRAPKQTVANKVTRDKQAQNKVRHKEDFFEALIENAMDAMVIINGDGAIRYKSPSIERVFGYKAVDDIGRSSFDFVHPDDILNRPRAVAELPEN